MTDTWAAARTRVAAVLSRSTEDDSIAIERQLDGHRTELTRAQNRQSESTSEQVEEQIRTLLHDAATANPEAYMEVLTLLQRLEETTHSRQYSGDHIETHHNTFHAPVQIKGIQRNSGT